MGKKQSYSQTTREWAFEHGFCWRCGKRGLWPDTLEIHHFVSGSSRQKNNLATTAMSCRGCHDDEHRNVGIGLKGWLFLKRLRDKEHYDLAEVCRVRGRAVTAITEAEIDAQWEQLESMGIKVQ